MASLPELQRAFAAALRDERAQCPVLPLENLLVYRNNSALTFREALASTFPVVRRRVGDDYFRQLAHFYRARFPSRSGDLHWIGREFATFLEVHLAGGDYAWLADLARLEWSCAEAAVAGELPNIGAAELARFAPAALEHLTFTLQPSLRLVRSRFPVVSVWLANREDNAPPVDQSGGPECGLVRSRSESVEVEAIAPDVFSFLAALQQGAPLGDAVTSAALDAGRLTDVLAFVFSSGLVSSVTRSDGQRVGTSS